MLPLILMAARTAISAYGAIKSNQDKADAEKRNADYYAEQADYAQQIGERELALFGQKEESLRSSLIGAYAKSGVEMTGSPLLMLEAQAIRGEQQKRAMTLETERRVRLARLRGESSLNMSEQYGSFTNQFLSTAPTILSAAGQAYKGENGAKSG